MGYGRRSGHRCGQSHASGEGGENRGAEGRGPTQDRTNRTRGDRGRHTELQQRRDNRARGEGRAGGPGQVFSPGEVRHRQFGRRLAGRHDGDCGQDDHRGCAHHPRVEQGRAGLYDNHPVPWDTGQRERVQDRTRDRRRPGSVCLRRGRCGSEEHYAGMDRASRQARPRGF